MRCPLRMIAAGWRSASILFEHKEGHEMTVT